MNPVPDLSSLLRRAARAIEIEYQAAGDTDKATRGQVAILGALVDIGPMPVTRVCIETGIETSTMTTMLGRMVEAKTVTVTPSVSDRRVRMVQVTKLGRIELKLGRKLLIRAEGAVYCRVPVEMRAYIGPILEHMGMY